MPRRRRNKRWIWRLVFLVLLIIAAVVCYLVWDNYFNDHKDNDTTTETSEQIEMEGNGETTIEGSEEETDNEGKKIKQYEGEDPNGAEKLSGVVTYAGAAGEKVLIRVNIDQYLENGKCILNIINDRQVVYEDTVNIIDSATTSTCEGFDIPSTELSNDSYEITIKIESSGKTGTIKGNLSI
ncbi:hypothetical protein IJG89_00355 [Candidatus Saccharibacteria bacterium]|nr:hypothetical protein [Candidatus Saccharibacteria bacterium]